jgi:hypothetical protein
MSEDTKPLLNTAGFFSLLGKKALEQVELPKELDPEVSGVLSHIKRSTINALEKNIQALPGDSESIETEAVVVEDDSTEEEQDNAS